VISFYDRIKQILSVNNMPESQCLRDFSKNFVLNNSPMARFLAREVPRAETDTSRASRDQYIDMCVIPFHRN